MLFPYHELMRHSRLSIIASSSLLLIWCKDTNRYLLKRKTVKNCIQGWISGLHKFTHMSFGLLNFRSSFCCLMEMCVGDQQFVTLLLYLDDIYVFAASIDEILDFLELVFKWLEEFNLKIKLKKCHFIQSSMD